MSSGRGARTVLLLLAMGLGSVNPPCRGAQRRFTVSDHIEVAHFGDPYTLKADPVSFSPDGQYFAVDSERGLVTQDRPESTIRVYRTEDIRKFLLRPEMAP